MSGDNPSCVNCGEEVVEENAAPGPSGHVVHEGCVESDGGSRWSRPKCPSCGHAVHEGVPHDEDCENQEWGRK